MWMTWDLGFVRALLSQRATEPRNLVYYVLSHLAMLKESRPYFTANGNFALPPTLVPKLSP